ncbi:MAG: ribbon-helix-helix protein, CopG family [Deltaproteobacteria bacterium]|nr:ribbon-helix-helix protein, CopG family [Deltaproteobacteria bacterium]
MGSVSVTARLDPEIKQALDLLAKSTARSKSFLISEAIRAYVKEQAWQIHAIKEAVEQADAGHFASNEEIRTTFGKWGVDVQND